jgi:hypothetical protein
LPGLARREYPGHVTAHVRERNEASAFEPEFRVLLPALDHKSDEIAQFRQSALHARDLRIKPEKPSQIPAIRGLVESLDHGSIPLEILGAAHVSLADQVVALTAQGTCYLMQVKLGMVLYAPEHARSMPDLDGLNLGDRVERQ